MNVFISLLVSAILSPSFQNSVKEPKYEVEFIWQYVNFTWPSPAVYQAAIENKEYIPENVDLVGMQYWKGKLFFGLPRFRPGVPASLAYLEVATSGKNWPHVTPYPDYETTRLSSNLSTCSQRLESIINLQVDPETGYLWLLDGDKLSVETKCPPKIVILDLNRGGKFVLSYELSPEICVSPGCLLNGIRLDKQSDKTYAYISDSGIDPGLIVFDFKKRRVWKLKHRTMFGDPTLKDVLINGAISTVQVNIDGLALTPSLNNDGQKYLLYSAFSSLDVYAISNKILIDPQSGWHDKIIHVGRRCSQGDDMIFDEKGTLYFTLVPLYAIGIWHFGENFRTKNIWIQDRTDVPSGETISFDEMGNMRVMSDDTTKFATNFTLELYDYKIRILKFRTNTKSYLY